MNTLENIRKNEKQLKCIPEYTKSVLVCFGASAALKYMLHFLHNIDIVPDFICDSDPKKQGRLLYGFKIYNPDELFSQKKNFFVLITSMYYTEIKNYLKNHKNISGSKFYLDTIPYDIEFSITKHKAIQASNFNQRFDTEVKIYVVYDNYTNDIQYENELKIAQSYGITDFLPKDKQEQEQSTKYLSYSSLSNEIIFKDNKPKVLPLSETKYNYNEIHYTRLLEYYIFDRYKHGDLSRPIIIDSWNLLTKGDLLRSTLKILHSASKTKFELIKSTQTFNKTKQHALVWHLYHIDMFEDIREELSDCYDIFDIYISINHNCKINDIHKIIKLYPKANIFIFENRGRDVLPFLNIFNKIYILKYESVCKIHTKKSTYRNDGKTWGKHLRTRIFRAKDEIINSFKKSNQIGAFVAENNLFSIKNYLDANKENLKFVCDLLEQDYMEEFSFPVGTMFWCRTEAIKQLSGKALEDKYFMLENGSINGQMEHAIEFFMGLLIDLNGYSIEEI